MRNSGQTYAAPTRPLIPRARKAELEALIRAAAQMFSAINEGFAVRLRPGSETAL